jgi:hypothetical protein
MGFFKIIFWKKRRGSVSPTMGDAIVSTEEPCKCDVGTNTDDVVFGGEMNSHQAPPPAEYAEGCEPLQYSPTMVDASASTEQPHKCDVGTNTDDVVFGGEINSHQAPPPVEYAEGCNLLAYYAPPEWPESYAYYIRAQEYEEWGQSYSYRAPAPEYAEWCSTYAYSSPPAYPTEWS